MSPIRSVPRTLAFYNIGNAYTKAEIDALLANYALLDGTRAFTVPPGVAVDAAALANWMSVADGSIASTYGVAYGNGLFVAVGGGGWTGTSSDGVHWTMRTDYDVNVAYYCVAFGNNMFVAAGNNGRVATSPDGVRWTTQTIAAAAWTAGGADEDIYAAAYGATTFMLTGRSAAGGTACATSGDNGVTWTARTTGFAAPVDARGAAYGAGVFAVADTSGEIRTTTTGATWTSRATGIGVARGMTFGGSLFVVVGNSGVLRTSPTGVTWTARSASHGNTMYGAAYDDGNGVWVTVADSGSLDTSTDGITWTARTSGFGASTIQCVGAGNGLVVAGASASLKIGVTHPAGGVRTL